MNLAKGLSILFIFLKNPLLVSMMFSLSLSLSLSFSLFLVSILFISFDLYYFLSSADFGLCFFFNEFIYLSLAVLGLHCCMQAFSRCSKWGLLFVAVRGLLNAVASLVVEHRL